MKTAAISHLVGKWGDWGAAVPAARADACAGLCAVGLLGCLGDPGSTRKLGLGNPLLLLHHKVGQLQRHCVHLPLLQTKKSIGSCHELHVNTENRKALCKLFTIVPDSSVAVHRFVAVGGMDASQRKPSLAACILTSSTCWSVVGTKFQCLDYLADTWAFDTPGNI